MSIALLMFNFYFLQCFFSSYANLMGNVESMLFMIFLVVFFNLSKFVFAEVKTLFMNVVYDSSITLLTALSLFMIMSTYQKNYLAQMMNMFTTLLLILKKVKKYFRIINASALNLSHLYGYFYLSYLNNLIDLFYMASYKYNKLLFISSFTGYKMNRQFLSVMMSKKIVN